MTPEYCMRKLCQECEYKHICHIEVKIEVKDIKFKKVKDKTLNAIYDSKES